MTIDPPFVAAVGRDARADLAALTSRITRLRASVQASTGATTPLSRLLDLLDELDAGVARLDVAFRMAVEVAFAIASLDRRHGGGRPAWPPATPLVPLDHRSLRGRDAINRHVLVRARTRLLGAVPPRRFGQVDGNDAWGPGARLRRRRRVALVEELLASDQVLTLDLGGDGRAVVAVGDPTTADHVTTLVPGIGTTIDTMPELLGQARSLRDRATGLGGGDVAVVVWLGHDAPPGPWEIALGLARGDALPARLATDPSGVDRAAVDLRRQVEVLRAANPTAHHALVGHSHGAVVAITAVDRTARGGSGQPLVDDLVLLGTPGTGDVDTATWDRERTRLWHAAAPLDPVPVLPVLGPPPARPASVPLLPGSGNVGHGAYLATGTWGLDAVAQVVAGRRGCPVATPAADPPDEATRRHRERVATSDAW